MQNKSGLKESKENGNLLLYNSLISKSLNSINEDIKLLELKKLNEEKNEEIQRLKQQINKYEQESFVHKREIQTYQYELQTIKGILNDLKQKNQAYDLEMKKQLDQSFNAFKSRSPCQIRETRQNHYYSQPQQDSSYLERLNEELLNKLEVLNYFLNNLSKYTSASYISSRNINSGMPMSSCGYYIRFTDYSVKVLEKELCLLEHNIMARIKALSKDHPKVINELNYSVTQNSNNQGLYGSVDLNNNSKFYNHTDVDSRIKSNNEENASRNKSNQVHIYETFNPPALSQASGLTRKYSFNDSILTTTNNYSRKNDNPSKITRLETSSNTNVFQNNYYKSSDPSISENKNTEIPNNLNINQSIQSYSNSRIDERDYNNHNVNDELYSSLTKDASNDYGRLNHTPTLSKNLIDTSIEIEKIRSNIAGGKSGVDRDNVSNSRGKLQEDNKELFISSKLDIKKVGVKSVPPLIKDKSVKFAKPSTKISISKPQVYQASNNKGSQQSLLSLNKKGNSKSTKK